jgi:hypothetical protein
MGRMRRTSRSLISAMAAASLLLLPSAGAGAPPQPTPVGVNAAIHNQVRIRSAGSQALRPAVLKARVMLNDEVRTGAASQLQILLLDRTTFTVGANARVAVDRFAFNPATNNRALGINVTHGAFRFMSGRALGHPTGPAALRTPIASIGIRGTIFEGAVGPDAAALAARHPFLMAMHLIIDPESATFAVLRGPGPGTQGDTRPGAIDVGAGGQTITLDRPGLAAFIPGPGATPIGPFPVTPEGLALLEPLLRTVPGTAAGAVETLAGGGGRQGSGPSPGEGGGHAEGSRGGGGFWLGLAAIPAVILGLIALGGGDGGDLPTSP